MKLQFHRGDAWRFDDFEAQDESVLKLAEPIEFPFTVNGDAPSREIDVLIGVGETKAEFAGEPGVALRVELVQSE